MNADVTVVSHRERLATKLTQVLGRPPDAIWSHLHGLVRHLEMTTQSPGLVVLDVLQLPLDSTAPCPPGLPASCSSLLVVGLREDWKPLMYAWMQRIPAWPAEDLPDPLLARLRGRDEQVPELYARALTFCGERVRELLAGISKLGSLTPRERQVLYLMLAGLTNPEIARRLERDEKTVRNHVSAVLYKLGASNRTEAVAIAALWPAERLDPPVGPGNGIANSLGHLGQIRDGFLVQMSLAR